MSTAKAQPVAVVGMGVRLPGARDTAEFWELLNHPGEAFSEPGTRFRLSDFHSDDRDEPDRTYARVSGYIHDPAPDGGGQSPQEIRWLRDCARQATEGVRLEKDVRAVCVVGAWPGGSQALMQSVLVDNVVDRLTARTPDGAARSAHQDRLRDRLAETFPFARAGCPEAVDAVRTAISGLLPAHTPVWSVDTACSSSLYALDVGAKQLRADRAEVALCGGVSVLEPTMAVLFSAIGGLSATGRLRALDAAADGTLFSDAAVLLTLKTLARARTDGDPVYGVLAGFGAAADGRGRSIAAPNPAGQIRATERARGEPGVTPAGIDWVIAHATGTRAGDGSEIEALKDQAAGAGWLCTATKSVIGHAGWAAGAASAVHALLAMQHSVIPAQPHFDMPARPLGNLQVPTSTRPWPSRSPGRRIAGVSAFGFGGTNAHLLLSDPPPAPAEPGREDSASGTAGQDSCGPRTREGTADELVLVAWSAQLPGAPDKAAVRAWLTGTGEAPPPAFGPQEPSFATVRLPAPTVRAVDRTQTLALEVAHRFTTEHGELWAPVRERTGVIAAHSGIPAALMRYSLRCHADQLTALVEDEPDDLRALQDYLTEVRARIPASGPDAMPGVLPNVIPSRITARYDLHGASICVDTGRTSTATALAIAADYLASGELDLALVLAVDAESLHPRPCPSEPTPRQGAFLLVVTRAATARTHGWPVTARLVAPEGPEAPARTTLRTPAEGFHTTTDAITLLAALAATDDPAPTVHLPAALAERAIMKAPPSQEPAVPALTQRYTYLLHTTPWRPNNAATAPTIPERAVILTDHAPTALAVEPLARAASATLLCTDPAAPHGLRADHDNSLDRAVDDAGGHLRVLARPAPWPTAPTTASTTLHELLFRALTHIRTADLAGSLGTAVLAPADHPHAALFTGLVPALIADHPSLPVRVVVTDTTDPLAGLDRLAREWNSADDAATVWYQDDQRRQQCLVPSPLAPAGDYVEPFEVVVASGGAGGVMTALLSALADPSGSRHAPSAVWILGTTDLGQLPADVLCTPEHDLPALRADLIARALAGGAGNIAEAATRADRQLTGRRTALNLRQLRADLGHDSVHYVTCDITDAGAVANTAHQVAAHHSTIDLFVHAATRSRSAPLGRKSLADFRLVRDVKVRGYHHLRDAFAPLNPRLWCNIASVAAAHPLRGEIDYGPANAFLTAAADHPLRTRELTIGFPLWRDSGYFATRPSLIAEITSQGRLTGITDTEGTAHFLAELAAARTHPKASIYLGKRERHLLHRERPGLLHDTAAQPPGTPSAHLAGATSPQHALLTGYGRPGADGSTEWDLHLDTDRHSYLAHHLVNGRPTMPGTFLLAAAAEAAQALHPGQPVTAVRDASFDVFVRPTNDSTRYLLRARDTSTLEEQSVAAEVYSMATFRGVQLPARRHFTAHIVLGTPHPGPEPPGAAAGSESQPDPLPPDPYYFPIAPVYLTGPFVNTRRWRSTSTGPAALWKPPSDTFELHPTLRQLPLPALLLCAVLRTRTLETNPDGTRHVVVPRHIARIGLYTQGSDHRLTLDHPEGITTRYHRNDGSYSATSPDGTVLLHITGFKGTRLECA